VPRQGRPPRPPGWGYFPRFASCHRSDFPRLARAFPCFRRCFLGVVQAAQALEISPLVRAAKVKRNDVIRFQINHGATHSAARMHRLVVLGRACPCPPTAGLPLEAARRLSKPSVESPPPHASHERTTPIRASSAPYRHAAIHGPSSCRHSTSAVQFGAASRSAWLSQRCTLAWLGAGSAKFA